MTYSIVYSSLTGNTAQLAERIRKVLLPKQIIYFGTPSDEAEKADTVFVGSWTDKGTCCPEIAAFLNRLHNKKVYIFGTAGFGGASAYFSGIYERIAQNLSADNVLLGYYMCQGKMPKEVRTRYEKLAETDPQKAEPMLKNFDNALSHPDNDDLDRLEESVIALLKDLA